MKILETTKGYIKGKISDTQERPDSNNAENEETVEESDMFSKNYWFGQEEPQPDPWLPQLGKTQRIVGFFTLLLIGVFCFGMAGLCIPFLILKLRKFVLLYTMGSMFTIGSFSLLWGPWNHIKHICSYERIPFTLAYFGTMTATLYSAIVMKSTSITLVFATLQIVSMAWYVFSYLPGGTTGLKFFTKLFASACTKTVSKTLPI